MNFLTAPSSQRGAIIVITLVLLLVMTTMGVGLVYVTSNSSKQVSLNISRTESLHTSETCIQNLVGWLEQESSKGPPCKDSGTNVCKHIGRRGMGIWGLSAESSKSRDKISKHSQECWLYLLNTVSAQGNGSVGTGFDVAQGGNYGGASTSTKYIYRIISNGLGPNQASTDIEVIVSMIF